MFHADMHIPDKTGMSERRHYQHHHQQQQHQRKLWQQNLSVVVTVTLEQTSEDLSMIVAGPARCVCSVGCDHNEVFEYRPHHVRTYCVCSTELPPHKLLV